MCKDLHSWLPLTNWNWKLKVIRNQLVFPMTTFTFLFFFCVILKIWITKSSSPIGAFFTWCLPIELAPKRCWLAWKFFAKNAKNAKVQRMQWMQGMQRMQKMPRLPRLTRLLWLPRLPRLARLPRWPRLKWWDFSKCSKFGSFLEKEMGFAKKNLDFFAVSKGDRITVECVTNGIISWKSLFYQVFSAKNQKILNVRKFRNYDEEKVLFREKNLLSSS